MKAREEELTARALLAALLPLAQTDPALFEVQFVPPLSEKKQEAIRTLGWVSYFKAHVFFPAKSAREPDFEFGLKADGTR